MCKHDRTSSDANQSANLEMQTRSESDKLDIEKDQIEEDVDPQYLSTKVLIALMFALSLAMLMASMDQTIVTVALPKIVAEFNALQDASWVGAGFFLTWTAFQGIYGKCSSIFGYKNMVLFALFFFLVGSLICALAINMPMLIVGRAIAGIGGAGIQSMTQIIVAVVCPIKKRGLYQGLAGTFFLVGTAVGPIIGGAFTDNLTWRWAFYINLPLGVVSAVAVVLVLRNQSAPGTSWKERFRRLDYLGVVLLLGWVICLLLPLSWGGSKYPWNSAVVIALFCVFGVVFALFIVVQLKVSKEPLMPASVFTVHRNTVLVYLGNIFTGMGMTGVIYYVPILYQVAMEESATTAGEKFIPFMVGTIMAAIITGIGVTVTLKYRPFACAGGILATIGTGLMSTWTLSSTLGLQVGCMILAGFGCGAFIVGALFSAQAPTAKEDLPITTAIVSFSRSLGAVIGVTLFGAIFNNDLPHQLSSYLPNLDAATAAGILAENQSVLKQLSSAQIELLHEAYAAALRPVFYTATAMFGVATLLTFATAHVSLSKEEIKSLSASKE